MSVALYAGSFDPIHLGHLGVIEHVARTHDAVVVAVVANPAKPSGMFTPEVRLRLAIEATSHLPSVRCVGFHGLTADLARREGATVLVRAGHKELASDMQMGAMNEFVSGIQTVFVTAKPATRAISSTVVRQLVNAGQLGAARDLVPECVGSSLQFVASRTS